MEKVSVLFLSSYKQFSLIRPLPATPIHLLHCLLMQLIIFHDLLLAIVAYPYLLWVHKVFCNLPKLYNQLLRSLARSKVFTLTYEYLCAIASYHIASCNQLLIASGMNTHTPAYQLCGQKQFKETRCTSMKGWHTPDLTNLYIATCNG